VPPTAVAALAASALVLAACGGGRDDDSAADSPSGSPTDGTSARPPASEAAADPFPGQEPEATETEASAPSLAVTHSAGVLVVDALTLETIAEFDLEGFTRVNAAGDGRHVMVSRAASPSSTPATSPSRTPTSAS
jgi:hypothetical protein